MPLLLVLALLTAVARAAPSAAAGAPASGGEELLPRPGRRPHLLREAPASGLLLGRESVAAAAEGVIPVGRAEGPRPQAARRRRGELGLQLQERSGAAALQAVLPVRVVRAHRPGARPPQLLMLSQRLLLRRQARGGVAQAAKLSRGEGGGARRGARGEAAAEAAGGGLAVLEGRGAARPVGP